MQFAQFLKSKYVLLVIYLGIALNISALGQGRYLNISLTGNYQQSYTANKANIVSNLGLDLGFPVTDYLELSIGHSINQDKDVYNNDYIDLANAKLKEKGDAPLEYGSLVRMDSHTDTSINAGIGQNIGYVRLTVFGGKLWRSQCSEDIYEDYGCTPFDTWNVGLSARIYMTQTLRFNISDRISPSSSKRKGEKYDSVASVGLTWGI